MPRVRLRRAGAAREGTRAAPPAFLQGDWLLPRLREGVEHRGIVGVNRCRRAQRLGSVCGAVGQRVGERTQRVHVDATVVVERLAASSSRSASATRRRSRKTVASATWTSASAPVASRGSETLGSRRPTVTRASRSASTLGRRSAPSSPNVPACARMKRCKASTNRSFSWWVAAASSQSCRCAGRLQALIGAVTGRAFGLRLSAGRPCGEQEKRVDAKHEDDTRCRGGADPSRPGRRHGSLLSHAIPKERHDVGDVAAAGDRGVERCPSLLVLGLQIGPTLDEELDDRLRASAGDG